MTDDNESREHPPEARMNSVEIKFPRQDMGDHFLEWWEREGWWSFCAWHHAKFESNSEWEQFMRKLWGLPPAERVPQDCKTAK